ncbi:MAG: BNR repeat-containing protein [Chitinophagaceae bacterium]
MKRYLTINFLTLLMTLSTLVVLCQGSTKDVKLVPVAKGWANTSVNAVVFRKNALVSHNGVQYIAFYDNESFVVLGKRKNGSKSWTLKRTDYKGNASDAHNVISIMVDGHGYLHMAWDHHNNKLHYSRSLEPGSLELGQEMPMTGKVEARVSYPEFYRMPDGNLVFFYRNGGSGQGNLVINKYDIQTEKWVQLHSNFIDGEEQRSAYWQACVDVKGTIHLSWVWRETPDVSSNHDICYARSTDGGITWESSTGARYQLPITAATAEYACKIPQKSELINQTSMFADASGRPYIATYWRAEGSAIPQYFVVYNSDEQWKTTSLGFRQTAFSLSGAGTKRIPISRPQIIAWQAGKSLAATMIFRDSERGNKVSAATCTNLAKGVWRIKDLTQTGVGSWEPSYDTELWKEKGMLNLFIEEVEQVDAEGKADVPPTMVQVLEWKPR